MSPLADPAWYARARARARKSSALGRRLTAPACRASATTRVELVFSGSSGQNLQVLKISKPVDDTAWATSARGSLYTTDSGADTVDAITGSFKPGTAYTAVAPCNANSAPTVCPAPPRYPLNSLCTINLKPARSARSPSTAWSHPRA